MFNQTPIAKQLIYKLYLLCTHVPKVGTLRILTSVSNFPIRLFLSMQINDKTVIHICSVIYVVFITVITTYSCLHSLT